MEIAARNRIRTFHCLCDKIIIPKICFCLPLSKAGGAVIILAGEKLPKVVRERLLCVWTRCQSGKRRQGRPPAVYIWIRNGGWQKTSVNPRVTPESLPSFLTYGLFCSANLFLRTAWVTAGKDLGRQNVRLYHKDTCYREEKPEKVRGGTAVKCC